MFWKSPNSEFFFLLLLLNLLCYSIIVSHQQKWDIFHNISEEFNVFIIDSVTCSYLLCKDIYLPSLCKLS